MDPLTDIPGLLPLWQAASGGDPHVRIAIIDGPVDTGHPSLQAARIRSAETGVRAAATIQSEHGTHVASVLVGQPGSAVAGIAPNCTATVYSIYREDDNGELEPSSQATLALAINLAVKDGAHIINISSGQLTPTGQAQRILSDAVRAAERSGALIVAAAGNDGCPCLQVPAALDTVLAVGACDLAGRPLSFSNFGDAYRDNGILAPGERVKGASPREDVALRSGTSFATPIVAGVIALLLSRLRQSGREADAGLARAALLDSATACNAAEGGDHARCLMGVLNVPGAVAMLFEDAAPPSRELSPSSARAPPPGPIPARRPDQTNTLPSPVTRESVMADQLTIAGPAPRILGPDGNVVAATAAMTPSEAPPMPAPVAGAAAGIAPASLTAAAQPSPAAGAAHVQPSGLMPGTVTAQSILPPSMQLAVPGMGTSVLNSAAGCGCGGGVRPSQIDVAQMAFPIGRLYYDFGTDARLDYFVQAIAAWRDGLVESNGTPIGDPSFGIDRDKSGDAAAPYNPEIMVRYLLNWPPGTFQRLPNLQDANAIIWTLTIDAVPIYAIEPLPVFGLTFYASLLAALFNQEVAPFTPEVMSAPSIPPVTAAKAGAAGEVDAPPEPFVTRVSFAGHVSGGDTTRLMNGTVVPTLVTDWRGFYQWNLETLLGPDRSTWPDGIDGFLERIYNEFRNVGISPQDRALNYSAMNAYNTRKIFATMVGKGVLDTVEVDRSVICRPDSDCWDVTYRFFDPDQVLTQARQVFQYTIDVSDVVPVAVGSLRTWKVY